MLGPFVPLAPRSSAGSPRRSAEGSSVDRIEVEYLGRIAERDTRPLGVAALLGVLGGHTEEDVNAVNAPAIAAGARHRGRRDDEHAARATSPTSCASTVVAGDRRERVVGTVLGRRNRPHLLEAWGQRFNLQLEPAPGALPLPRRARA